MRSSKFCSASELLASASWLLTIAVGGIGCSDSTQRHFISVDEDAYLRGEQVATIDVSDRLGGRRAVRAELYLDGQRVAADELAPFELVWDTRKFADGEYDLQPRVYLDDNEQLDDALTIHIDNTAPRLGDLPRRMVQSQSVNIPATDNFEVTRVELSRGVAGEMPTVLVNQPYVFRWPWPCGDVALQVRVVDRAGGETVRLFDVNSIETPNDEDCDQHRARASGGDDCNDADPAIHGRALEYLDGVDRNCDGVVGPPAPVDRDGDGVASVLTGGADCDDGNLAIHGKSLVLAHRDLVVNNTLLTWNTGEAVLSGFHGVWELSLNRDGVISRVRPQDLDALAVEQVATGANRGSIHATDSNVIFGRGNQVVVMGRNAGTGWVERSVIPTDGPVGAVAFQSEFMSAGHIAFQAGTKVYFASLSGSGTTPRLLVDAGAPIVGPIMLWAAPAGASVVFRTADLVWKAVRVETGLFTVRSFAPPGRSPFTAMAAYTNFVLLMAVDQGTGSALYDGESSTPLLSFPRRITSLFVDYPYAYVHVDGLGTQVLSIPAHYTRVQMLPQAQRFDTTLVTGDAFAASGYVEFATPATVFPPADILRDSVDMDCNGSD
jgi:hypothetical protein